MIRTLIPDMPSADEVLPYLRRIDEARVYSNNGPLVRELEDKLSNYYGAPVVTVSNGTLGIELALRAFGLEHSTVAVPAATFIATVLAAVNARCLPHLCDVNARTWQLTPQNVPLGVGAIIPVATFGQPVEPSQWRDYTLPVIIDAAGAFLSQKVTADADAYCFSLHATKHIGAGEGGFVVAHDSHIIKEIRRFASFGVTNAKMSEYHAAVALASLARLDKRTEQLGYLKQSYARGLGVDVKAFEHYTTIFPMMVPKHHSAAEICTRLLERDIETKRWYQPFACDLKVFDALNRTPLPVTQMLTDRMIGLPFHSWLSPDDVSLVCRTLAEVLK